MGLFSKRSDRTALDQRVDQVIDLRTPSPPLVWGAPAPCPECGGHGYLDGIHPADGVMYQHCTECWHRYEVTEAQVEASQV